LLSVLLDTALIDHGRLDSRPTTLDLGVLVGSVVQTLRQALAHHL
jgi:hypothetical protein